MALSVTMAIERRIAHGWHRWHNCNEVTKAMNAAHDELYSFSTFWLVSCVLHAVILLVPVNIKLPRTIMSSAIEVMRIHAPTIVEGTKVVAQSQRTWINPKGKPSKEKSAIHRSRLRYLGPKRIAMHPTSSMTKNPASALKLSGQSEHNSAKAHMTTQAVVKPSGSLKSSESKSAANIQVGTLPRDSKDYETPKTGNVTIAGIRRTNFDAPKQTDAPTLTGRTTEKVGERSLTSGISPESVQRAIQTGVNKASPNLFGVEIAHPTTRSVNPTGSEPYGGYSTIVLGRTRGSEPQSSSDELVEQPKMATGDRPPSPPTASGIMGDAPSGFSRNVGRGKSTPVISELFGALKQSGESGGITSGSLKQARLQPRVVEPTPIEPQVKGYTGLIIDARGWKVERSMSPRIYDERGRSIYGPQMVPANFAIEKGVVRYHTTFESALKDPRAGPNPLIVKATGVRGAARQDVIVSTADGEKILRENEVGHFLQRCNVIFVIE